MNQHLVTQVYDSWERKDTALRVPVLPHQGLTLLSLTDLELRNLLTFVFACLYLSDKLVHSMAET